MSKFKGTLGKWEVSPRHEVVNDSKGYAICQISGITNQHQWKANALLISKSPQMLEMLEEMYDHWSECGIGEKELDNYMSKIKALINEATEI